MAKWLNSLFPSQLVTFVLNIVAFRANKCSLEQFFFDSNKLNNMINTSYLK